MHVKKIAFVVSTFLIPVNAIAAIDNQALLRLAEGSYSNQPIIIMLGLAALSLLPFVGMMLTSFVKIAVVLSITRQAIGTQQAPPTTVVTGLALILTIYAMHPLGYEIYQRADKYIHHRNKDFLDKANIDVLLKMIATIEEPVKDFLAREASDKNVQLFYRMAYSMRTSDDRTPLAPTDLLVLVPAFVVSELTKAFQIGFIIFLPFLIVDMVVSNILMALGMQMLSPTTISLPFKILLFVMVDGWYLISKGLVLGYRT